MQLPTLEKTIFTTDKLRFTLMKEPENLIRNHLHRQAVLDGDAQPARSRRECSGKHRLALAIGIVGFDGDDILGIRFLYLKLRNVLLILEIPWKPCGDVEVLVPLPIIGVQLGSRRTRDMDRNQSGIAFKRGTTKCGKKD